MSRMEGVIRKVGSFYMSVKSHHRGQAMNFVEIRQR